MSDIKIPHFETIVLGGGCFWCLEATYSHTKGVESVVSGYAGGKTKNPSYEEVRWILCLATGITGNYGLNSFGMRIGRFQTPEASPAQNYGFKMRNFYI